MKRTPLEQYQLDLRQAITQATIGDWFERYINHSRGMGNTIALINACKQAAATLITVDAATAAMITDLHKVKTAHIHDLSFAHSPTRSVVDNFAIRQLATENRKLVALSERLLSILSQKGIK